ncbi:carbohydrate kinase family protein [Thermogladius sp.]|uniref:carbohydrate kinase family protein n=1 Tax=Thermogladius sp. TaxID=2023064 RepID=UPI003D09B6FD
MSEKRVFVYGDLNLDVIYFLDTDELVFRDVSYVARRGLYAPGGVAGNLAVAARRLGSRTSVIAKVGEDVVGVVLVKDLETEGVGVRYVAATREEPTGVMSISVKPGGGRVIVGYRGANRLNTPSSEVIESVVSSADAVFAYGFAARNVDRGESLVGLLTRASRESVVTGLDLSGFNKGDRSLLLKLKKSVTYAFINLDELEELVGSASVSAAEALYKSLEPEVLFLKMGERGSMAIAGDKKVSVKAFNVMAVDTTGSGDAFNAGVLYSVLEGFDLDKALLYGNAMGAYKALGVGARHLPRSLRELEEFIEAVGRLSGQHAL